MAAPYQYLPLFQDEIRVMVLLKGRQKDTLNCQIFHVCLESFSSDKERLTLRRLFHRSSIEKPHSYEALSYVWGSISTSESLRCDGRTISITPNLRDALLKLRLARRHRALWVDQICINQSDKDEKSNQVALMGRIYRMAVQVIAWSGLDPDGFRNLAYTFLVGIAQGKVEKFD